MSLENEILIDNYLKGLLNDKEIAEFKLRLQSDAEFRRDFQFEKALRSSQNETDWSFANPNNEQVKAYKNILESEDLQNLKKSLKKVNSEFKEDSIKSTKYKFYYLIAASLVLFLCLSIFLNKNRSNQKLVDDYLNTSDLPSFVSRGEPSADDLIKAQQFFENENYQKSLDIFIPAVNSNEENISIYLYIGIAQIKLKQYDLAESTFDTLIQSNSLDAEKGFWYKALLYLDQDRFDDAKTILNRIISKSLYNHIEAKELLSKLGDE